MKKYFLISLIFLSLFIFSACSQNKNIENTKIDDIKLVGNDLDAHGCKASAGYSWCKEKNKCLRVWEEMCEDSIYDFITELNKEVETSFTFIGKTEFDWLLKNNEKISLLGLKFLDLKLDQDKLNILLNFINKNTEVSLENQADSSVSSLLGFRKNLDVCQLSYTFNNVKENEDGIIEPLNDERKVEIICTMYK
jgi:hypothetical protein